MIRARRAGVLATSLLVACSSGARTAASFDGSYPVTLTLITAPAGERCAAHAEQTLTVEHAIARLTWTLVHPVDLKGAVDTDGTARASASDQGRRASLIARLDPAHHAATGTLDSDGCIYDVKA